jgi:hypothetical protein
MSHQDNEKNRRIHNTIAWLEASSDLRERVATVMFYEHSRKEDNKGCSCGWKVDLTDSRVYDWQYRLHLSQAILRSLSVSLQEHPADNDLDKIIKVCRSTLIFSALACADENNTKAYKVLTHAASEYRKAVRALEAGSVIV